MSGISTHVLDTSRGVAATGVGVALERDAGGRWEPLWKGVTDGDGRARPWPPGGAALLAGDYRLSFESGAYFATLGIAFFHPRVEVRFTVADPSSHHHVPLLLGPFGYTTYRGS